MILWLAGMFGLPHVSFGSLTPLVALLDVVLVLIVFKGDIRLTKESSIPAYRRT